jgi:hypothetical protein
MAVGLLTSSRLVDVFILKQLLVDPDFVVRSMRSLQEGGFRAGVSP